MAIYCQACNLVIQLDFHLDNTPIELLMKTHADHSDLFRTNVWECLAFVLDLKLQNSQKFPNGIEKPGWVSFLVF